MEELKVLCQVIYENGTSETVEVDVIVLLGNSSLRSVKDYLRENRSGVKDVVILDVGRIVKL